MFDTSVKKNVNELSLLFEISRLFDQTEDLNSVFKKVLEKLAEHRFIKLGSLTILNRKTGEIFIESSFGMSDEQQKRGKYRLGEGITGEVIQTGQPAVIPKISEDPHFLNKTGAREKYEKKDISFICSLRSSSSEVIGAISVDRMFDNNTSLDEDLRLLTIISSLIAQAVKLRQKYEEENKKLLEENIQLHQELRSKFKPANIIGNSSGMVELYKNMERLLQSPTTVLIRGESGTGKELIANAVHYNSLRVNRPFIKVNCAALPETIIESELFGHERGAFTGAITQRKGRFELADTGTIFLDEISEIPTNIQAKILRVLQEREFERVGGSATIKIDVRVIAATNRNLENQMQENKFREDLYYRLNVFPLIIPPLRERRSDIPMLADFFVDKYNRQNNKNIRRISTPAIDMLMIYHWPGNVRELENCIERAVLLSDDDVIHSHHLPPTLQTAEQSSTEFRGTLDEKLEIVEKELILDALKSASGKMSKAARILGISERIIGLRISKYKIDAKQFTA